MASRLTVSVPTVARSTEGAAAFGGDFHAVAGREPLMPSSRQERSGADSSGVLNSGGGRYPLGIHRSYLVHTDSDGSIRTKEKED